MNKQKVIFDFGANKGQNIDYYLSRAEKVIAVEAVPSFANQIREEYSHEINQRKLFVVNGIVGSRQFIKQTSELEDGVGNIYESLRHPGVSTIGNHDQDPNWKKHRVKVMSVADIIREYCEPGETPFYVKIDLEGADKMVLQEILETGLIPQYLSVEIHDKDVVNLVLDCRFFESFRIETAGFPSKARDGRKFSRISAGPFGEDFVEFWLSRNAISILAKLKSQNARDIHASSIRMPCTRSTLSLFLQPSFYRKLTLSVLLQKPEIVRVLIRLITTKRIRDKGREVLANLYFVKQKKNANKSIINEFQRYTRTNKSSSKH